MQLIVVDSDVIYAVGYDTGTRVLEVVFKSEAGYQYDNVPPEVYQALLQSESKGKYFVENIRDVYPCYPLGRRGR